MAHGHIPGIPVGHLFANRLELSLAGIHRATQAGIVGTKNLGGAESIVLNGGYEDDVDLGDEIIYTGHGGNDPKTGEQIGDQELIKGNAALAANIVTGIPVRVIRGSRCEGPSPPETGYRYDGLYRVDDYWIEPGLSGFNVCRFHLVKTDDPEDDSTSRQLKNDVVSATEGNYNPRRAIAQTQRVVRISQVGREIKGLYNCRCQRCGIIIVTPAGAYAEAAHIVPLGEPHNGPDVRQNVICLCPNCHVTFDLGAWSISDDFKVIPDGTPLVHSNKHGIDQKYVENHRRRFGWVTPTKIS